MKSVVDASARASPAAPLVTTARSPGAGIRSDRAFLALVESFRRHDGLVGGDAIAERLCRQGSGDLSALARRIVAREVICFEWRGEQWLPLIQFDLADMSLRPALAQAATELAAVFDGWALCRWLVSANSALGHRTPLDMLDADAAAVLRAARIERFVIRGRSPRAPRIAFES